MIMVVLNKGARAECTLEVGITGEIVPRMFWSDLGRSSEDFELKAPPITFEEIIFVQQLEKIWQNHSILI